jgi:hypothetical protein
MNDIESPEKIESAGPAEGKSFEAAPEHFDHAADILENPPEGSFQHGLQAFIAWAKTLFAQDK